MSIWYTSLRSSSLSASAPPTAVMVKTRTVSKIFDWYEEDFVDAAGSLHHYLLQYADTLEIPANHRKSLDAERLKIQFLDYDWSLNSETNGS